MNADRETNRLPLRAGAMLLLAVAVVFIGLGWHSAATGGDSSDQTAAEQTTPTTAAPATSTTTGSATPSTEPDADVGSMCVLNAGTVTGLASDVADSLRDAGFEISDVGNLSTSSISENTVFYDAGDEAAAQKVAQAVPGGASADPRPDVFTDCAGELVVIVVSQ